VNVELLDRLVKPPGLAKAPFDVLAVEKVSEEDLVLCD
jgi:hypothetical protein